MDKIFTNKLLANRLTNRHYISHENLGESKGRRIKTERIFNEGQKGKVKNIPIPSLEEWRSGCSTKQCLEMSGCVRWLPED